LGILETLFSFWAYEAIIVTKVNKRD
jgi:hypothetical protein